MRNLKATKDGRCIKKCEAVKNDLLSLGCSLECSELCGYNDKNEKKRYAFNGLKNITEYYGLNAEELKLIADDPVTAFSVYLSKNKAEAVAEGMFRTNDQGDESDAVRHFSWALLTCLELGPTVATRFLNAHEMADEAASDKGMDLSNNRIGITRCEKLKSKGKRTLETDELLAEVLNALKKNELTVLKPKRKTKW